MCGQVPRLIFSLLTPLLILFYSPGPLPMQVGEFSSETGEMLEEGQIFRLDLDEAKGDKKRVMLPHPEIIEASEVGHTLLVDDGKVKLKVSGKVGVIAWCKSVLTIY